MNRAEYMKKLEELLMDIPAEEREDAIAYYNDYFDEGGVENEQANIEALGSPEKLAQTIRSSSGESGQNSTYQKKGTQQVNTGVLVLIIILAVLGIPVWLPVLIGIGAAILGVIIGIIAVVFAIGVTLVAIIAAMIIAFFACLAGGFIILIEAPFSGLFLLGIALLLLAVGLLSIIGCIAFFSMLLPWLCRVIPVLINNLIDWTKKAIAWIKGKIKGLKGGSENE